METGGNPELLYRAYINGSTEAFEQLMELYREHLIFFLYRYVQDLPAAEDLAEDVFVEVLVHGHRYNFRCSVKTYLFSIARHKAVNFVKRESRRRELREGLALQEEDGSAALEEHLLKEETKRRVNTALGALREEYRMVLHLLYIEELSVKDTARIMGKTVKQTESLAYRARAALRAQLGEGEV